MDISILKSLNFPDKYATLYFALLQLGPSSVRTLSEHTGFNRGTAYDALKWLQEKGVVSFYKEESKQQFVAEHPQALFRIVEEQRHELERTALALQKMIPELEAIYNRGGERPVARYFGAEGIEEILEDVLQSCEKTGELLYRVYSSEPMRAYLYKDFPGFSDARVAKGISVRVIAMGKGGELRGLDERRYLDEASETPTYNIIYPGKTASISLNAKQEPIGVTIENDGICETQKLIFDRLWKSLEK